MFFRSKRFHHYEEKRDGAEDMTIKRDGNCRSVFLFISKWRQKLFTVL